VPDATKLRELASWYREFAERTDNPAIWEVRLLLAEDLEKEADRLDGAGSALVPRPVPSPPSEWTVRSQRPERRQTLRPAPRSPLNHVALAPAKPLVQGQQARAPALNSPVSRE